MRRAALRATPLALIAGPTVLAFFSGGYFAEARAWAGLGAWLLVAVGALAGGGVIARRRGTRLAIGALAGLAAWSLLSILWAPVAGDAYHAGQIVVLYLGALVGGTLLLRPIDARRLVEPGLAAGCLIVIGYGLSARLAPGLLHFARSVSASGRLEQPLTYWNAMGELAAIGFVLCARLAGDSDRQRWLRTAAVAAAAPLGMGLYISFSRGALFACLAGVVALVATVPRVEQLWGVLVSIVAAVLAAIAAAPFGGVTGLTGSLATRERQGAITFALLVVIMLVAAAIQWQLGTRERPGDLPLPRRTPVIVTALICAGLALAIVVGARESSAARTPLATGATRLGSLQSNRYAYWRVGFRAFGTEPVHGVGAGNWNVYWLRWRPFNEYAQDAHSLPVQMLAELGVVGIALLFAFLAGVVLSARAALRSSTFAAGPVSALVVYLAHAPLDWDWQMPAVTLVAMLLAGSLLAAAEAGSAPLFVATRQAPRDNKIASVNLAR